MLKATNRLGIIFFPAFDWAISPTHPEREERLLYTQDQLREEGIFDIEGITEYKPDMAAQDDVSRIHFCIPDVPSITTESHLISAGGAIKAARLLMDGAVDKAFALVRPPGHHAMKVVHGSRGFCKINIEAVMIEYIREHYGQKRVAIVDTDCHHGDGTQDIYWNDPNTLFISLHQDGRTLYPGTGFIDENGGPNALNRTINIPLPPGTCDEGFIYVIDNIVLQILADFKPDLIINSAGQDNHYSDPLTNMTELLCPCEPVTTTMDCSGFAAARSLVALPGRECADPPSCPDGRRATCPYPAVRKAPARARCQPPIVFGAFFCGDFRH